VAEGVHWHQLDVADLEGDGDDCLALLQLRFRFKLEVYGLRAMATIALRCCNAPVAAATVIVMVILVAAATIALRCCNAPFAAATVIVMVILVAAATIALRCCNAPGFEVEVF